MIELAKSFLTNEIVINWIAPIITALVTAGIPVGLAKLVQSKRDERKINDANQRFINAIRPYIIQEISILPKFISDIRNIVVQEAGVKDKFVYSELNLRNKLIIDITESKYIDEKNKEKLIKFTYGIFEFFDNDKTKDEVSNFDKTSIWNRIINMPIVVFIISMIFMILIAIFDKGDVALTENPLFAMPFLLAFIASCRIIISMLSSIFESKVSIRKYNGLSGKFEFDETPKIFYNYIDSKKRSNELFNDNKKK